MIQQKTINVHNTCIFILLTAKVTLNSQTGGDIRQDIGKVELQRQKPES